jgi:hypothetical protein
MSFFWLRFALPTNRALIETATMTKLERWFQQLDKFKSLPFMPDGRHQPLTPSTEHCSAIWLKRRAGVPGDPSLRLKNGSSQDDTAE